MIRYVLRIPQKAWERPEHPRREVLVTLMSKRPSGLATLQFDGDEKDVKTVHDALLYRASGNRGAIIEADTTPLHLVAAMDGPVMKVFDPERLEGRSIFQPLAHVFNENLDRLADLTAGLFTDTLPPLSSFNNLARADLIERLRLIILLCGTLCKTSDYSCDAGVMLATKVNERLAASGIDKERLQQLLQESCELLEVVILGIPQTNQQVIQALMRLGQFVSDPAEASLQTLCEDLISIWQSVPEL